MNENSGNPNNEADEMILDAINPIQGLDIGGIAILSTLSDFIDYTSNAPPEQLRFVEKKIVDTFKPNDPETSYSEHRKAFIRALSTFLEAEAVLAAVEIEAGEAAKAKAAAEANGAKPA